MAATTAEHVVDEAPAPRRSRRRPSRRALAIAMVPVTLAILVALLLAVPTTGGDEAGDAEASGLPPSTTDVTTTDLTSTEAVDGTLSYGTPVDVMARATQGTVTWLAPEGSVVGLGQPLYKVDELPVVLIHGTIPPYRPLAPGAVGGDVQQFEQSLAALGGTGFTVDTSYTSATAEAVEDWQASLGLPQTGTVGVEQIVVAPSDVRVAQHGMAVGTAVGGGAGSSGGSGGQPVLSYTGSTRVVTIALDVAKQHLVAPGIEASVLLPDGTEVAGTVLKVGTVVEGSMGEGGSGDGAAGGGDGGQGQGQGEAESPTVEVVVAVPDQGALGTLDAAPVSVTLVTDERQDVLAVPVAALVALAEGGYGVQVVDHGQVSYVPVETGLFADGMVEVSGDGIAEGTVVGVPT